MFVDNLQTSRVDGAQMTRSLPPRLRSIVNSGAFTPRIGRLALPPQLLLPGTVPPTNRDDCLPTTGSISKELT